MTTIAGLVELGVVLFLWEHKNKTQLENFLVLVDTLQKLEYERFTLDHSENIHI